VLFWQEIGKDDSTCKQPVFRKYANGAVFLLVFADGTGNVLYPSKNYLSISCLLSPVVSYRLKRGWTDMLTEPAVDVCFIFV